MNGEPAEVRFGTVAVEKGFVTSDQLIEAMLTQIVDDMEKKGHRLIGQILVDLGYMNVQHVQNVLEALAGEPGQKK